MIRAAFLAIILATSTGPTHALVAEGLTGHGVAFEGEPRSLQFYWTLEGYSEISERFHGTPMNPAQNHHGILMLTRIVRNVCLSLERDAVLDDVVASAEYHFLMAREILSSPPTHFGMVPVSRVFLTPDGHYADLISYDRFCDGLWCRASTNYDIAAGEIWLATTLNLAEIPRRVP